MNYTQTLHAVWADEITGVMMFIKKINKNLNILKKQLFKKILHSFSFPVTMCVYWNTESRAEHSFKEEMYNTVNSYSKYASISKSPFYNINILILPISTGEKCLKIFHTFCLYLQLPAIMNLIFRTARLENLIDVM